MELEAEEFQERENLGKFLARKTAQDRGCQLPYHRVRPIRRSSVNEVVEGLEERVEEFLGMRAPCAAEISLISQGTVAKNLMAERCWKRQSNGTPILDGCMYLDAQMYGSVQTDFVAKRNIRPIDKGMLG